MLRHRNRIRYLFALQDVGWAKSIKSELEDKFPHLYVDVADRIETGYMWHVTHNYEQILLDPRICTLSGINCVSLFRQACKTRHTRILVLVGTLENDALIQIFNFGADMILHRDISNEVLIAQLRALYRRDVSHLSTKWLELDNINSMKFGEGSLIIRTDRKSVIVDGKLVKLSRKEFEVLTYLAVNANTTLSIEDIHRGVWGRDSSCDINNVYVVIRQLRNKIGDNNDSPRFILNRRGYGYMLVSDDVDILR